MAAATCLSLFANVVQDIIVAPVLSFVETNIRSTEWQLREASVMAFGSILEGPDQTVLNPLILSAFPTLLGMMSDPIIQVKDTAAWTLGRLIELNVDTCLTFLPQLVSDLVTGVDDSPRVASNCAWAFVNLCIGIQAGDSETYQLSPFFEGCVMSLMSAAEKNAAESNVRSVIYEGVSSLVSTCAKDCFPTVEKLTLAVVERLEHTSRMQDQIVGADEKRVMLEIQANLCSVLTVYFFLTLEYYSTNGRNDQANV